jgi:hypothetical protein
MTIEQTVEIPADHRLVIDVPREVPAGRAVLAFTPVSFPETETAETAPEKWVNPLPDMAKDSGLTIKEALELGRGIAKRMGSRLTSDLSIEWRREDRELEEAKYRRMFPRNEENEP